MVMPADSFALPAFILSIVGLVVAVVGALTGVVSLTWQIATRRRGAHNVRITVSASLLTYPDGTVSDWFACVSPANIGASPVAVTGWGLEMPGGGSLNQLRRVAGSADLPHTLEPGTSINLLMPTEGIREALAEYAPGVPAERLRAWIRLGTGETVYAKKRGVPAN
jgi:hypothetical protein